jgi:hypothetical protein
MLKFPAYLTGFRSKSDGSAGLTFATQELTGEDFSQLKQHHNAFGWLVFSPNESEIPEAPSEKAEEDGISASERLRRVMFVYFKQKVNEGDFDTWRKQQLEALIEKYKEKLD